jgi:hypothetical protein
VVHTGKQYTVIIKSVGSKPVPIDLTVYYTDGTNKLIHKTIACWQSGNKTVTLNFSAEKKVDKMILGNGYDADANKEDNIWMAQ